VRIQRRRAEFKSHKWREVCSIQNKSPYFTAGKGSFSINDTSDRSHQLSCVSSTCIP